MIKRINESGAIKKSLDEANQCAEKAVQSLEGFPEGKEKEALLKLGPFLMDRDL